MSDALFDTHRPLMLGAVAYDPKVVTIWRGFRDWLLENGLGIDFVLYSNYEHQVEDLIEGAIDVAWNSPLAWVRARRLGEAMEQPVKAVAMRDTDRDLASIIIVRADAPWRELEDLIGNVVATGAVDSPQATLLPLAHLGNHGVVPGKDIEVRRFEVGVGLHGDHLGGERGATEALMAGEVDAACILDASHLAFARDGTLRSGATRILTQTGLYDHCNMTARFGAPENAVRKLTELLLSMDYADAEVRPLLDLEGLKAWVPGRTSGYAQLEEAVDASGFYDSKGAITSADYRP